MDSRRSSRWSIESPWTRGLLLLVLLSGVGIWIGPLVSRQAGPPVSRWLSGFRKPAETQSPSSELKQLRTQLSAVTKQLMQAERKLETVAELNQLNLFIEERHANAIYAQVVAYSPDPGIQTVSINRGESDGVQVGLAAVSGEGFVVGVVRRVTSATATVVLLTDPQTRLVAKIQNESVSRGLVEGGQGLAIRMNFIPKHEQIQPGQLVATAGTDANIPVDLPIGTVGAVTPQQGDLFQTATVLSSVDFQNLNVVAVIPPRS